MTAFRLIGRDVGCGTETVLHGVYRGGMEPTEDVLDSPTEWVARHIRGYVECDGKKGHRFYGNNTLLLTTRGRRSGRLRRTALIYGRHGDAYVVVASNGGSPTHPLWYLNLVADPRVYVQVGARTFTARARTAAGKERPQLWQMMIKLFGEYARYQKKTEREIPVVVLDPADRT